MGMAKIKDSVFFHTYLTGYAHREMPRSLRRLIARSETHRAWLSGFHGRFIENEIQYGPADPYVGRISRSSIS